MLSLGSGVRVFVAVEPVDMRGSFDALAGAVRRMGLDPVDGHLYLFFNRRRRLCKIDARELWSKRVERWKNSGLSAKEFARELGINANTLAYWGRRLKPKGAPPRARPRTKPELRFVEVVPAAGTNALSIAAATIPSGVVESASAAPEGATPEPLEVGYKAACGSACRSTSTVARCAAWSTRSRPRRADAASAGPDPSLH